MKHFLEPDDFLNVISLTSLVSIDVIVRNHRNDILVGKRVNEPAQGFWFVPGGRIAKLETLDEAFTRIVLTELGLDWKRADAAFLGVFEHIYDTNALHQPDVHTHYVVLGYEIQLPEATELTFDQQHSEICWMAVDDLLANSEVHPNTQAYFRK